MAEAQAYAVPDLTQALTYTNPAGLPDIGQTQLDQLFSQTPVSMPVNDVISAIQSQYQPVDVNYGGGPYGAARFIGSPIASGDVGSTVNTLPTWFQPGAFDINAYNVTPQQQLSNQIAAGDVYGGSSPLDNVGSSSINDPNNPYASWGQNVPNALKFAINAFIPGAGLMIGAGQGYNQTQLGNTIGTGLSAYGGQTNQVSPTLGAVLGALGITNPSSNLANMMGKNFSSAETMYGYMDAATNPVVSQITEALLGRAGTPSAVTPEMVGVIGYSVGSEVQSMIASGASIGEAVSQVAANMGLSNSEAAAMGANAAKASVESAIQTGTPLSELNPADVAAYQDSLGSLISLLGIEGIQQQLGQQQTSISDLASSVQSQGQAQQDALSAAVGGLQGQISDLATSYQQQGLSQQEALNAAMSDVQGQLADLSAAYEAQGMSQTEAMNAAIADVQGQISQNQTSLSDLMSTLSDQSLQISDLTAAYEAQGLSQTQALNAAMTDIQNQFGSQGSTIASLQGQIQNYQQQGLNADAALQQTIADVQTGLQGSINTQSQQFQDLLAQNQSFYQDSTQALQQTISDMQSGLQGQISQNQTSLSDVINALSDQQAQIENLATPAVTPTSPVEIDVTFPETDPNTTYTYSEPSGGSYGGVDNTGAPMSGADADIAYGADQYETQSSSSSGGGGGKIVCTAMNHAYGFGSFRNQIWLKYSADKMTKAHEVGYHTLFLPLVDLGYKKDVKVIRKVLEHIARHRTADLRAEMRGTKRDSIGRVYRAVLEPLCYIVGKLKGY